MEREKSGRKQKGREEGGRRDGEGGRQERKKVRRG